VLAALWGCDDSSTPTGPTNATALTNYANTTVDGVRGDVRDTLRRPVSGARVEIGDGPLAGRTITTGPNGRFDFPGMLRPSDTMTVRVTRDGYSPASVQWRGRNDISVMLVAVNRLDFTGSHFLTITAAPSCSQLPPPLRVRSYIASMNPTQNVFTAFTARLSGAEFFEGYDTFWTGVAHDAARFHVFSWYAFNWWLEDLPIIERVGPNGYLAFQGIADAPMIQSPTAINARFDGSISFCPALTPPALAQWAPTCAERVECQSDRHELKLIRR
jgi:hypothetical protein